jgi:hypothetical protein
MLHRTMLVPLFLAGLLGSLLTVGLEHLVLLPPMDKAYATPSNPLVIQAQQFELLDTAGAVRGVLQMAPEGTGPEIALLDESGHRRITMAESSEGEYGFATFDAANTQRFGVGTTRRGFVGLNVRDGHGVIRSNLYASDDGSDTGFRTWDADGHVRAKLGAAEEDPSIFGVRVFDAQSQLLWQAP